MRFNALTLVFGAVGSLALPALTHATVLTFQRNPDFTSDRQFEDTRASSHDEYGDRVGDANTTHNVGANRFEQVAPATNSNENVAGTYYYGDAGGATPNVIVSYPNPEANFGPRYAAGGTTAFPGYGDLAHVAYIKANNQIRIDLIADPGYSVSLASFDLAAMNEDLQRHVDLLRVLDGSGNVLWDSGASAANPLHIANSYRQVGGQMHNSYGATQFGGALTASTIRLEVSAYDPDPTDGDAASAFKIAIDNIQFSQALVPEPASLALLGLGGLALLRRRG